MHSVTPGQPFYLDHIQIMAQWANDLDAEFCTALKNGVPLGVDSPVLRSPGIWPTKEEPQMDMVLQVSDLRPQPLTKGTRSALSMTVPGVEPMLTFRQTVRSAPQLMDCLHGIHWLQAAQAESSRSKLPYAHWDWPSKQEEWLLLKADVTKAHRRIKIFPAEEWKYQIARLGNEWWVNKVGTYGMASAQIYWGRMAALLLRLVDHIFPGADWGFVFVDDFCWLLRKSLAEPLTASILLFMLAFGCLLSWKKTAIGASNTWLGFIVTRSQQLVRMAPTKHELVMAVLSKMMANEEFTRAELDSALGRLQWATNCCPLTKPFLQAFWQWKTAVRTSGRPNKLLRGFANLLHKFFEKDYNHPSSYAPQGASDASASDDGLAFVGGWLSNHPTPEQHQVWWFHYQVEEATHPWAFKDKKPKRMIAALEMFGTLILTTLVCQRSAPHRGPVQLFRK